MKTGNGYSVEACKNEYLAKFPRIDIEEEESLLAPIRRIVDRFNKTGNVSKKKSPVRPQVSEEIVEDLSKVSRNLYRDCSCNHVYLRALARKFLNAD
jgi:hypothetical protein